MSHDAENGSVATIDHKSVTVSMSPRRPDSYSRATSRDMIRDQKKIETKHLQNTNRGTDGRTVTSQPTTIVARKIVQSQKPKDYVVTSWAVILLCNFVFGIIAYCYGLKANYAWQLGDLDTSRQKARMALIFVIIGICFGIFTYILVIVLVTTCCSPFKD